MLLVWIFYSEARRLSSKLLKQGYLVERLKSSFRKFYGRYRDLIQQYEVSLSRHNLHSDPWPIVTSEPIRLSNDYITLMPSLTFTELWVVSMEHLQRVWYASKKRLPFRTPDSVPPFWDLLVLQLLRPDSSNLPCLYSNFYLEYPLVISRFYFAMLFPLTSAFRSYDFARYYLSFLFLHFSLAGTSSQVLYSSSV